MTVPGLSFIGRLFNRAKNMFTNLMQIGGNMLIYPDIDAKGAIDKGWSGNGTVYSVVSKDARKFASIPRYLYKINGKEKEAVSNPLNDLLERPNEYQGQDAFLEAVRGFYKITGEAFVWLNRGDTDKLDETGNLVQRSDAEVDALPVLEMYVMPSNHVYLIPDPGNVFGILGYEFEVGGKRLPIRKNDVIHWKSTTLEFDAYDRRHLRGMPALKPGKRFLQRDNDGTDSSIRMMQNDGARGIAFNETFDDLSPVQKSDVQDVVNKRINNNDIKGAIATVQGKWGYVNFGGTAVDMELLNSLQFSRRDMCMLFDVPPEFFLDTTYENKEKAMKGWVLHSILPACKQWDDECNRVLLRAFKLSTKEYKICVDSSELPELQVDMSLLVTQMSQAWWITPNEKRKVMGYEPLGSEFDEPWIPGGITALSGITDGDGFDSMVDELDQND